MAVIVAFAAACGWGSGDGGGSTPKATSSHPERFVCTLVIGFSQTRAWFLAMEAGGHVDGDRWQLLWHGGAGIGAWADQDSRYWNEPIVSPCPARSLDPDRVVLTITGNESTPWGQQIAEAVENIRMRYPDVRDIRLQPVVGGPDHEECLRQTHAGGEEVVRASANHPTIDEAIAALAGGDVRAGADPLVASCSDFRDDLGHLTQEATDRLSTEIAAYYGN